MLLISASASDSEKEKSTENNMRSLLGLTCVVVAASFYLYSLSLYLPAGPRRRPLNAADREHVGAESEHPTDTSEEPSRFLLSHKLLTHLTRLTFLHHLKKKVCCAPTTTPTSSQIRVISFYSESIRPFSFNFTISV